MTPPMQKSKKIRTCAANSAAASEPPAREGFCYTKRYIQSMNKFERALHDAGYPWVHAYTLDAGEFTDELEAEGKHVLLLEKGELEAENKSLAWTKPMDRMQFLDATTTGQKQLPIRARGKYVLTAQADSEYYEAHVCLTPTFAHELITDDRLRFFMADGKPAANATVLNLLDRTTFQRKTKKGEVTVRVIVPNVDTSQVSKAIRDWFRKEWKKENYNKRRFEAKTLDREEIGDLFSTESDDEEASTSGKDKGKGTGDSKVPSGAEGGEDADDLDEGSEFVEGNEE